MDYHTTTTTTTCSAPKSKRAIKYANDPLYRERQIRYVNEYRSRKKEKGFNLFLERLVKS